MSADLRRRLHDATTISPRPVNRAAIKAEVARRKRKQHLWLATGILTIGVILGGLLPLLLASPSQDTVRLTTTPPPDASPTGRPSPSSSTAGQPMIHVSTSGPVPDGASATVTGTGFAPGVSVQIVPCLANSDCGAYRPIAAIETDHDGSFTTQVTLPAVANDLYGGQAMCVQHCSLIASTRSGTAAAKSEEFNLASLPPSSEQCQPSMRTLQLTYAGLDTSHPNSQSAVIKVHNAGTNPCWLDGAPGVTATRGNGSVYAVDRVVIDRSPPAWPPKVITLQAGATAQFTVFKPRCTLTSASLGTLNFGLFGGNYSSSVPLPTADPQSDVSSCDEAASTDGRPAADNIMTVTPFTTG